MKRYEKIAGGFDALQPGDWVTWRAALGGSQERALIKSVTRDCLAFDFGRADMPRAQFESLGAVALRLT